MTDDAVPPLTGVLARDAWQEHAACRGVAYEHPGANPFFPVNVNGVTTFTPPEAAEMCARCPVRPECTEAGRREMYGVWGGDAAGRSSTIRQRRRRQLSNGPSRYDRSRGYRVIRDTRRLQRPWAASLVTPDGYRSIGTYTSRHDALVACEQAIAERAGAS